MNEYISSGAFFAQILGIAIVIIIAIFYNKKSHEKAKKRGSIYITVDLFLMLPWYVGKIIFLLMGISFSVLPIFSL
ncbi:hypothetical protein [Bacillus sp. EAC]|uniref:hypothetical protein n=1 Tax=Bacillus sp. EAC TaxID=1978338 RepID=UPI001C4F5403|nr:hypothetical protein [Bacillus sp. EAC]